MILPHLRLDRPCGSGVADQRRRDGVEALLIVGQRVGELQRSCLAGTGEWSRLQRYLAQGEVAPFHAARPASGERLVRQRLEPKRRNLRKVCWGDEGVRVLVGVLPAGQDGVIVQLCQRRATFGFHFRRCQYCPPRLRVLCEQPRVTLAGFLQLGLFLRRLLLGQSPLAPLCKSPSQGQLQLRLIRLSLDELGKEVLEPRSELNDWLSRLVTAGPLECDTEVMQGLIMATVDGIGPGEL